MAIVTRPAERAVPSERARNRIKPQVFFTYLALAVIVLIVLFPLYWMLTISLKTSRDIYREPSLWPRTITGDNFAALIGKKNFFVNVRNSLIVSLLSSLVSVFISSLAAYSLTRLKFRGRGIVSRLILLAYLTPGSLLFIPLSVIVAQLQLGNSLHGLIILYLTFACPLSTWLLMGYFRGVPADLEEQAMVDGTTRMGALFRILLPVSAPGLAAVSIFTFTGAWNELLFALIFITSPDLRTVPLGLQYLITGDVFLWGQIMAGAVIAALPVMVLYFIANRFMVQGISAGAVKG